ncbi:DsrE family protein [Temperatibacter marinus]|uniref:DsrE family protein n=1 Tax=Temperatibacter marinus TaxID=1456591 RepID=A0AA52HB31_9PROT|nr:DsrE family protein [Temperatibacter marinus]WND03350.1 DsrE family protein [Temperatibacter marinus]
MATRPMTIMVITPSAETIHQALLTATSACSMGQKTYLYFGKEAAKALVQDQWVMFKTHNGESAMTMDKRLEEQGLADFQLLLSGLAGMNASLYICEQAMKEYAIDPLSLLLSPQPKPIALSDLIVKGSGGDWLTF